MKLMFDEEKKKKQDEAVEAKLDKISMSTSEVPSRRLKSAKKAATSTLLAKPARYTSAYQSDEPFLKYPLVKPF